MKNTKKLMVMLLCLVMLSALGVPALASLQTVSPMASTVIVNGTAIAFEAYNIDGNNFFKLRDLAYALSGSSKQFSVGWDGAASCVVLSIQFGQPDRK